MDIQATKISLAKMILQTESVEMLERIQKLFKKVEKNYEDDLSEEQKKHLEESYTQAVAGEGRPWEEVKKEVFLK